MMRLTHKHARASNEPVCSSEGWAFVENKTVWWQETRVFARAASCDNENLRAMRNRLEYVFPRSLLTLIGANTTQKLFNANFHDAFRLNSAQIFRSLPKVNWWWESSAQKREKAGAKKWEINFSVKYPSMLRRRAESALQKESPKPISRFYKAVNRIRTTLR